MIYIGKSVGRCLWKSYYADILHVMFPSLKLASVILGGKPLANAYTNESKLGVWFNFVFVASVAELSMIDVCSIFVKYYPI